jgi:hypothetical protein
MNCPMKTTCFLNCQTSPEQCEEKSILRKSFHELNNALMLVCGYASILQARYRNETVIESLIEATEKAKTALEDIHKHSA